MLAYPAGALLQYIGNQPFFGVLGPWRLLLKHEILRVYPSVAALQQKLTVGIHIQCNAAIEKVSFEQGRPAIDGEPYDHVVRLASLMQCGFLVCGLTVVASRYQIVGRCLPLKLWQCTSWCVGSRLRRMSNRSLSAFVAWQIQQPLSEVFDRVQYQSSSIIVHTDPSFMPPKREDWRTINVHDGGSSGLSCLTVWMNSYYYDRSFDGDVFQTWNPYRRPIESHILDETHFQRVVHTKSTGDIQSRVAALQGQNGLYFCGSYSSPGVGLLEQAAASALKVAHLIKTKAAGARA